MEKNQSSSLVCYALYDFDAQEDDELSFIKNDCLELIAQELEDGDEGWWYARKGELTGLIPSNYVFVKKTSDEKQPLMNDRVLDEFKVHDIRFENQSASERIRPLCESNEQFSQIDSLHRLKELRLEADTKIDALRKAVSRLEDVGESTHKQIQITDKSYMNSKPTIDRVTQHSGILQIHRDEKGTLSPQMTSLSVTQLIDKRVEEKLLEREKIIFDKVSALLGKYGLVDNHFIGQSLSLESQINTDDVSILPDSVDAHTDSSFGSEQFLPVLITTNITSTSISAQIPIDINDAPYQQLPAVNEGGVYGSPKIIRREGVEPHLGLERSFDAPLEGIRYPHCRSIVYGPTKPMRLPALSHTPQLKLKYVHGYDGKHTILACNFFPIHLQFSFSSTERQP